MVTKSRWPHGSHSSLLGHITSFVKHGSQWVSMALVKCLRQNNLGWGNMYGDLWLQSMVAWPVTSQHSMAGSWSRICTSSWLLGSRQKRMDLSTIVPLKASNEPTSSCKAPSPKTSITPLMAPQAARSIRSKPSAHEPFGGDFRSKWQRTFTSVLVSFSPRTYVSC